MISLNSLLNCKLKMMLLYKTFKILFYATANWYYQWYYMPIGTLPGICIYLNTIYNNSNKSSSCEPDIIQMYYHILDRSSYSLKSF